VKRWQRTAAGYLLLAVAQLLRVTYRVAVVGQANRADAAKQHANGSFCLALWHEQLFGSIMAHAGQHFAPLASLSEDGELVTFVMNRLGFNTVRGSSSRGGEAARDGLVEVTSKGWFTAVTVDGPRGPRRRVKGGVVDVARRSGVAVVPLATVADRVWVLRKSWDQFKIPKPFARVVVSYGTPVAVPAETQGLAFGAAKAAIKDGLAAAEAAGERALASR
jgi:lysophospholipid acyltransferase (LPLAT)-like uncharacterized protein